MNQLDNQLPNCPDNLSFMGEVTPLLPRRGSCQKQTSGKNISPISDQKSSSNAQTDTIIVLPGKTVKEVVNGFVEEDERRSLEVGRSYNVVEGPLEVVESLEIGESLEGSLEIVESLKVVKSHNVELVNNRGSLGQLVEPVNAEDDCEAPRWLALAAGGVPMVGYHHQHHHPQHLH